MAGFSTTINKAGSMGDCMKYKILVRSWGFDCIYVDKRAKKEDITGSFTTDTLLTAEEYTTRISSEVAAYKEQEIAEADRLQAEKKAAIREERRALKAAIVSYVSENNIKTIDSLTTSLEADDK
jgi:hypothetical protein